MDWRRFVLGLFVPHSVVMMIGDVLHRPDRRLDESLALQRQHQNERRSANYSYEAAVAHLVRRGLPEAPVREGSMGEDSLHRCAELLRTHFDPHRPLTVLHVGNFLGLSLSWFADFTRSWNPESRVVAIDPNVTHRGIERPQEHVIDLLTRFGLQDRVMLVTGYTLGKNPSDLDPDAFARDQSCENALANLARLAPDSIDVALIDGNHEAPYLRSELREVRTLLRRGGLLVLDDVFDWRSLIPVGRELTESADTTLLMGDGRLGVWQAA